MMDYSEALLKMYSGLKRYHNLMLKHQYEAAAEVMKDVNLLSEWLTNWTKEHK